jgi:hypothetical protein
MSLRLVTMPHGAAADACVAEGRGPVGSRSEVIWRRDALECRCDFHAFSLNLFHHGQDSSAGVARDSSARCAAAASFSANVCRAR